MAKRPIADEVEAFLKLFRKYGLTPRRLRRAFSVFVQRSMGDPQPGFRGDCERWLLVAYIAMNSWLFLGIIVWKALVVAREPMQTWTVESSHFYKSMAALFGMALILLVSTAILRAHAERALGSRTGRWVTFLRILLLTPGPRPQRPSVANPTPPHDGNQA